MLHQDAVPGFVPRYLLRERGVAQDAEGFQQERWDDGLSRSTRCGTLAGPPFSACVLRLGTRAAADTGWGAHEASGGSDYLHGNRLWLLELQRRPRLHHHASIHRCSRGGHNKGGIWHSGG